MRINGAHVLNTNRVRRISDVGTGKKQGGEEANAHSFQQLQIQPQNHQHLTSNQKSGKTSRYCWCHGAGLAGGTGTVDTEMGPEGKAGARVVVGAGSESTGEETGEGRLSVRQELILATGQAQ